jgi:inhibitor of cysteine peptidase
MVQIDKNHNGSDVEVAPGEQIELRLGENPTTGYRWHLRSSTDPILAVHEDTFASSGTGVGAGGIRCWRFQAGQAGTARVELENRRSWENRAIDQFAVNIRVKTN